jgi:chlorobactene glucosyltransferase
MLSTILLVCALFFFAVIVMNIMGWPKVGKAAPGASEPVSVLIPARNEESNLAKCLDQVLKQGQAVVEVLVYNDHSTDETGRILDEYAKVYPCVRSIDPLPLAPGWCGKNFACAQLAQAAKGRWLLFIDADARLGEDAVNRMIGEMRRRGLKFLSCWPAIEMVGFWERALMPTLNFVVLSLFPAPFSVLFSRPSLGLAHGACLMFESESYRKIGGHAAVKEQIFEDVRLAQLWRERGERGLCLDGRNVVSVRMYDSFEDIRRGFQKNFFPAFRRETSFWAFILFHLAVFLSPFLFLIATPNRRLAAAAGIVLLSRFALAAHFHHPLWSALAHPLSELILIWIGLSSWRRCKSGKGVEWRGRRYRPIN